MNLLQRGAIRWPAGIALCAVSLIGLLYAGPIYRAVGPNTVLWIYDLAIISSVLMAVGLAFLLWRSFSPGEASKGIWACLGVGLLLWAVGEGLWSYDQLIGGEKLPYPSAADVAWLVGYIPLTLGLWLRYRSFQMRPRQRWQIIIVWVFVGLAILAVMFVVMPIALYGGASSFFEQAVNILYPVGDLILAFQALLLGLVLAGGSLSMPWGLIAAGILCLAVSDLSYVFSVWRGWYEPDPASGVNFPTFAANLLYAAGYVVVCLGLYVQARIQKAT